MLYFIEGVKAITPGLLVQHGLDGLIPKPKHREVLKGPAGKVGIIVSDESLNQDFRFVADQQLWEPRFGFPETMVGIWKDNPPTPEQLAMPRQIDGPVVKLLDGNSWMVPMLREWRMSDEKITFVGRLPTVLRQDPETGELVPGRVVRTYEDLWNESLAIADEMLSKVKDNRVEMDEGRLDHFVGSVLGVNYRVTLPEISILGLFDVSLHVQVLQSALDWHRLWDLMRELEKNLTGRSDAGPQDTDMKYGDEQPTGATAATIPTGQPLATSSSGN